MGYQVSGVKSNLLTGTFSSGNPSVAAYLRGNKQFDVHFDGLGLYVFRWKKGQTRLYKGRNRRKGVYFPPELAFSL